MSVSCQHSGLATKIKIAVVEATLALETKREGSWWRRKSTEVFRRRSNSVLASIGLLPVMFGDICGRTVTTDEQLTVGWAFALNQCYWVLPVERGRLSVAGKDVPLTIMSFGKVWITYSRCPGEYATMARDVLLQGSYLTMLTLFSFEIGVTSSFQLILLAAPCKIER